MSISLYYVITILYINAQSLRSMLSWIMVTFVCAHVSFAVFGVIALSDIRTIPPGWVRTPDKSIFGLVWISEKLMIYKHSTDNYTYVPDLLSLALSVIILQTHYTFRCLVDSLYITRVDAVLIVSSVACIAGLNILITYDHRDRFTVSYSQWNVHVCGVFLFIIGFLVVHLIVAWTYNQHAVIVRNAAPYSWYRRKGYFFGDGIYLAATVVFVVCVCFQQVVNAIMMEYILLIMMWLLNTFSLLLLFRLEHSESDVQSSLPSRSHLMSARPAQMRVCM